MSSYYNKYPKKITFSEVEDDSLPEDLEKGDLILISHIHKDHCKEVTIDRLRHEKTLVLTPKKYKKEVSDHIKIVTPKSKYNFENIWIETVDAYNTPEGHSTKKVHKKGDCIGFIINMEHKRIYFAGDTDFIPEMKDIKDIDVALVPIGGTFTMDIDEAVEAAISVKPKCALPIHHLKADPLEFKMKVEEKTAIKVIVLDIGEEYIV